MNQAARGASDCADRAWKRPTVVQNPTSRSRIAAFTTELFADGERPADSGATQGLVYHLPMATLSRDDVSHVAHLARLGLSEEELARLEGQLNHILDQYAKLAELDTEAIPPTAQTIELENILRDDVVTPSLPVEEVLRNASESSGGYIVVPPILGE